MPQESYQAVHWTQEPLLTGSLLHPVSGTTPLPPALAPLSSLGLK